MQPTSLCTTGPAELRAALLEINAHWRGRTREDQRQTQIECLRRAYDKVAEWHDQRGDKRLVRVHADSAVQAAITEVAEIEAGLALGSGEPSPKVEAERQAARERVAELQREADIAAATVQGLADLLKRQAAQLGPALRAFNERRAEWAGQVWGEFMQEYNEAAEKFLAVVRFGAALQAALETGLRLALDGVRIPGVDFTVDWRTDSRAAAAHQTLRAPAEIANEMAEVSAKAERQERAAAERAKWHTPFDPDGSFFAKRRVTFAGESFEAGEPIPTGAIPVAVLAKLHRARYVYCSEPQQRAAVAV